MAQILFIFIRIFFTPLNRGTERTSWIIASKRSDRRLLTTRVNVNSFLAVEALLIANSNALITDLQLLNANLLLTTWGGGGGCVIINQCLHGTKRVGLLRSKHERRKRFLNTGANIRMSRFRTCRTRNTHERPLMREGPTDYYCYYCTTSYQRLNWKKCPSCHSTYILPRDCLCYSQNALRSQGTRVHVTLKTPN